MTFQRNNNHRGQHPQNRVVLNVAEKPSVARALASAFGRFPESHEGPTRREAAQIFIHNNVRFPDIFTQGNGPPQHHPQQQRQQHPAVGPPTSHTMITTSVRGHLATTDFPKDYGWSRVDPIQLFDAPLEVVYSEDMKPLQLMLSRLSKDVHAVILWLDCDREGEAIADEVRQVCIEGNRNLEPYIYRAKFSTVMEGEIKSALQTLGRVNEWFVQAVHARSQIDLRVGAAFTRFQTLRLQKKFQLSGNSTVVSYGPCQFPTLGFVVERWARIETFIPEDFWFIELSLRIPGQQHQQGQGEGEEEVQRHHSGSSPSNNDRPIHFAWKRSRLYDQWVTLALYESCLEAEVAVVTQMNGRPKSKWRPVPLATVELQKRASRYLRIGSETLMQAAEALYQQGFISYPRTETERFRPEFQHQPLLQDFANMRDHAGGGSAGGNQFAAYAEKLLNGGFQNPRAGQHDDQAHPPITPCKAVDPNTFQDRNQREVYTLVVKHYLACCSKDAQGKETSITVQMGTEEFTATGLMILEKNWLEIYEPWERWSTGQGQLPPVQIGSRIVPTSLLMKEGQTSPPQLISEVELISIMDRNGIGTDATIAQHISTIQDREYATKDASQRFSPTPLGIALIEGYNQMGYQLNKPDLRREMEYECNLVANQQKTKDDIIGPILEKMRLCFQTATAEAHKLDEAVGRHFPRLGANNENMRVQVPNFSQCGICQGIMSLKVEGRAGTHRSSGGSGGAGNGNVRKIIFCNTCQEGWTVPRGELRPKMKQDDHHQGTARRDPVKCPICNYQVVEVARGEGYEGNGYHFCPKCFTDSPEAHGGNTNSGNFRCFSCTHPTCELAGGTRGGEVEVFSCPFCREQNQVGKVTLRKNSRGYVLSCSNYSSTIKCPYTIWLPRESQEVSIPDGDANICRVCTPQHHGPVRKVSFKWKPGSAPPHLERDCTVCILCNVGFRQDLQVSLPQRGQVGRRSHTTTTTTTTTRGRQEGNMTAGGRGNGRSSGGRGGSGRTGRGGNRAQITPVTTGGPTQSGGPGRGGNLPVCYRCHQPGHYSNACPTRSQ